MHKSHNLTLLIVLPILISCNHQTNREKVETEKGKTNQMSISLRPDSGVIKMKMRRKEFEKKGYDYSPKINSKTKIIYENKELTFIRDLLDSANNIKGSVYVELINDSLFKNLYILNGDDLKYFVGNNILTNKIDTTQYGGKNLGLRFELRCDHYLTITIKNEFGGYSDGWTIKYIEKKKRFDNPYRDI